MKIYYVIYDVSVSSLCLDLGTTKIWSKTIPVHEVVNYSYQIKLATRQPYCLSSLVVNVKVQACDPVRTGVDSNHPTAAPAHPGSWLITILPQMMNKTMFHSSHLANQFLNVY